MPGTAVRWYSYLAAREIPIQSEVAFLPGSSRDSFTVWGGILTWQLERFLYSLRWYSYLAAREIPMQSEVVFLPGSSRDSYSVWGGFLTRQLVTVWGDILTGQLVRCLQSEVVFLHCSLWDAYILRWYSYTAACEMSTVWGGILTLQLVRCLQSEVVFLHCRLWDAYMCSLRKCSYAAACEIPSVRVLGGWKCQVLLCHFCSIFGFKLTYNLVLRILIWGEKKFFLRRFGFTSYNKSKNIRIGITFLVFLGFRL